jgi:hypothetical protein
MSTHGYARLGPEAELILINAGTAARRHARHERSLELARAVDWRGLTEMLRAQRLVATLGPRVIELARDCATQSFASMVEREIALACRQGALLQLVSERVTAALGDAGIRSTVLKGPLLSEAAYGEPGRRQSSDIDLLVPTDQLASAVVAVQGLGYGAPGDHVRDGGLPLLHFALRHLRRELPTVELHWRIHWYERDFAREQLLPGPGGQSAGWRPDAAAELAALLLFYARDGFVGLRLASDLSAWWDAFGASLGPGALELLLEGYPALQPAVRASTIVAETVVGLPAAEILGRFYHAGLRERMAVRLANPIPVAGRAQLYADIGLVDLLLARNGLREFVSRQVLVAREVRLARKVGEGKPVSALGHAARVLARYGLAVTRLASGMR